MVGGSRQGARSRRSSPLAARRIERGAYDPAARVRGVFAATPRVAERQRIDGHRSDAVYDGVVTFDLDGTPLEHWIIRRWVSDVEGNVAIGVTTHKLDGNEGNGVLVRLVVDDKVVYLQPLARWDTSPRRFVASATLNVGSTVDLVIDAFDGNEAWDHTVALVRVWQ